MAEYLFNRQNNQFISTKDRDNADYQCFFTWKKGKVLTFIANYRVKLTGSYKEVKKILCYGTNFYMKFVKKALHNYL